MVSIDTLVLVTSAKLHFLGGREDGYECHKIRNIKMADGLMVLLRSAQAIAQGIHCDISCFISCPMLQTFNTRTGRITYLRHARQ